ncbi:MAG: hypothetical protein ACRED3_20090, partial [Bradyrhizobium sp.]
EYARDSSEPYLFNHAMRSWLFADILAGQKGAPYDREVLAVSAVLHDLGLTEAVSGPLRFEVEGANAARAFVRDHGMDEPRAGLVWDSIALNSTPSICLHKQTECALCVLGVGVDWGGWGYESIPKTAMATILEAFPREGMKHRFSHAVCGIATARPETTYDNFARDFGERFVAGYRPPSSVDALMNAPYDE